MTSDEQAQEIRDWWIGSHVVHDIASRDDLAMLVQAAGLHADKIMLDDERDLLASLPDPVRVYRGISAREPLTGLVRTHAVRGFSWTLDHGRADWFASRYLHEWQCVVTADIPKHLIAFYFDGRSEQEIVTHTPNEITIVNEDERTTA